MKIKIKGCSFEKMWYKDKVGEEYEVFLYCEKSKMYWVRVFEKNIPGYGRKQEIKGVLFVDSESKI